eukprot:GHVS01028794.1.p1 GENE.GHVS01028794.1~~GHVS01028794.1.p1  ORF type:complete len:371 (-),score=19.79 GHVS01028794.1:212-1324(-)
MQIFGCPYLSHSVNNRLCFSTCRSQTCFPFYCGRSKYGSARCVTVAPCVGTRGSEQPSLLSLEGESLLPLTRFYSRVHVHEDKAVGWKIYMDFQQLRTPKRKSLILPTFGLASAIAYEWDSQAPRIQPSLMPLMGIATKIVDGPSNGADIADSVLSYFRFDSLCFGNANISEWYHGERVPEPTPVSFLNGVNLQKLRQQQFEPSIAPETPKETVKAAFDKIVKDCFNVCTSSNNNVSHGDDRVYNLIIRHFEEAYGVSVGRSSGGLSPPLHPDKTMRRLRGILCDMSEWQAGVLFCATAELKSLMLGFLLLDGTLSPEVALSVACLESFMQRNKWGWVEGEHDVQQRSSLMDLHAAVLFSRLSGSSCRLL